MPKPTASPDSEVVRDRYAHLAPSTPDVVLLQLVDSYMRKLGPSWRLRTLDDGNGYALEKRHRVANPKGTGDTVNEWRPERTYDSLRALAQDKALT